MRQLLSDTFYITIYYSPPLTSHTFVNMSWADIAAKNRQSDSHNEELRRVELNVYTGPEELMAHPDQDLADGHFQGEHTAHNDVDHKVRCSVDQRSAATHIILR
jgi:hypothetical protein